jgi:L-alanine-DL-glutamate epimerase-like enolase superfamily enzyme
VEGLEIVRCDAGWRNYYFLKLTTDEGIVGWSEFDEGFGSPGVSAVVERLAGRVIGQPVFDHERIYTQLYCLTRLYSTPRQRRSRSMLRAARRQATRSDPGLLVALRDVAH